MPRDGSGFYTLPAGNPVVDGTIIDVDWANPTMSDIATQLNNVLTRDGVLGPTLPFKLVDGTVALPGLAFAAAASTGMWRNATALSFTWAGVTKFTFGASSANLGGLTDVVTLGSTAFTKDASGNIQIGGNTPGSALSKLRITSGTSKNLEFANTESNFTNKSGYASVTAYDNANPPTTLIGGLNTPAASAVRIGGGLAALAPCTGIELYTDTASGAAGTGQLRFGVTSDGRVYGTALHNNAGDVSSTSSQFIASGTYSPTPTNGTNMAAVTCGQAQWLRVGNVVTVSGNGTVDATAGSTNTGFRMTLPIPSNLGSFNNLGGIFSITPSAVSNPYITGRITGDTTNDEAVCAYNNDAGTTGVANFSYTYTYLVA